MMTEKLFRLTVLILGHEQLRQSDLNASFRELGGDSVAAVRLSDAFFEAEGLRLEPSALLNPRASMQSVLARSMDVAGKSTTFAEVHGEDPELLDSKDFVLSKFLPDKLLTAGPTLPLAASSNRFLLTGATGFLGHVILASLLEKLEAAGEGWVACLVRAKNDAAARARIEERFAAWGPEFARLVQTPRLRVFAGDITEPGLGLTKSAYAELTDATDAVIHPAAQVNHVFDYRHLFAPNVVGTARVLGFAIERTRKRVHLVSSAGVTAGRDRGWVTERDSASTLWPRRKARINERYAFGYATTKWAGEILASNMNEACDLPVTIYRCTNILTHSRIATVVNVDDVLTRLLFSILATGAAPKSFYPDDYPGSRHFDGLPVDLVAAVIAQAAMSPAMGLKILHISNSNWEAGISIDTIVGWLESAGCKLERFGYADWYKEFVSRLQLLSAAQRQRSIAPIVERLAEPMHDTSMPQLDTTHFRSVLATLGIDRVPCLDEAYVRHLAEGVLAA